jgi:hypothetical protein
MEYNSLKENILITGLKHFIESVFNLDKNMIWKEEYFKFNFSFEEIVIIEIYLKKLKMTKKLVVNNRLDMKVLVNLLEVFSKNAIEIFQKEIEQKTNRETANINLTKFKIANQIFLSILKDEETEKSKLLNALQCLEILASCRGEVGFLRHNFLVNIVYEIPEIENCKKVREDIEYVLKCLEFDDDALKNFKNTMEAKRQLSVKNVFLVSTGATHIHNTQTNQQITKRKASYDKNDNSVDKDYDEKNNFRLEKYFKTIDDKYTFNSDVLKSSIFSKSSGNNNKLKKIQNTLQNNYEISDFIKNSSIQSTKNSTRNSPKSQKSKLSSHLSESRHNSQIFNENSQMSCIGYSYDSTMKRPLNYNSQFISSAKSASSQFSFNPRSYNSNQNVTDFNSNYCSDLSKTRSGSIGINSVLATKLGTFHVSTQDKKKKPKEKVQLIQKLFEKIPKSNSKLSESKKDRKKSLKNAINKKFYKNQEASDEKIDQEIVANIPLQNENISSNIVTEQDTSLLGQKRQSDNKPSKSNKGSKTKNPTKDSKSKTGPKIRAESKRNICSTSCISSTEKRERKASFTDDEILVYATPIKTQNPVPINKSPGVTTRKNLYNLFQQIDKSG